MTIDEKFAAAAFTASTAMSYEQVLAAADDAAERSKEIGTSLKRVAADGAAIVYEVRRLKGLTMGQVRVQYSAADGGATVSCTAPDYAVFQDKLLFFIPIGPKESPALGIFRTFSKVLRQALDGVAA
ncbi:hypothetical protein [Ruania rhizosphaerae]|uniref:hypothetical protein n=1 Tax=Ruania rhizosphaerae TaxID=1840413 RepID=UPI00135B1FC6|nr:hypothetical protein [Ruania rhizosphaerae]